MTEATAIDRLVILVTGRPAPQGSKRTGAAGQMREQSAYLPAWRAAVKRAAYEAYRLRGVDRGELPLFRGSVAIKVTFWLDHGRRIDGAPDLDKLLRSTWDSLTQARVWEDDGRVIAAFADKRPATAEVPAGAVIEVWGCDQ